MSMSKRERIFHSLLFEGLALIILTLIGRVFLDYSLVELGLVAFLISVVAMVWNYLFNQLFDHCFGANRIERGMKLRALHAVGFEVSVLMCTLPIVMGILDMTLLQALALELVTMVFYLIYTFVFNLAYDHLAYRLKHGQWAY